MSLLRRLCDDAQSRGAVLVEMALLTPLLMVLLLGTVDFGRMLAAKIAIVEATEEGALYAAYHPDDYTIIQTQVVESLDSPSIITSQVAVSCPGGPSGEEIKVTVTHDMDMITPFISNIFGPTITLTGEVTAGKYGSGNCAASP